MKICPFCDEENEDNASKCTACGTELGNVVSASTCGDDGDDDNGLYTILMGKGKSKWMIKFLKKKLHIKTKEAKAKCMLGQIDGLSKADADALVKEIRMPVFPARAVKASMVEEYKAKLSEDRLWVVKIFEGDNNPDLIAFYGREFDLGNDAQLVKDHLFFCIHDGEGEIYETDCQEEAIAFAEKVRACGVEASLSERAR